MKTTDQIKAIQRALGVADDGNAGPKTWDAIYDKIVGDEPVTEWHRVKASSFADPADVRAFKRCKAQGKTDQQCFKVGDNGIGAWGHNTAQSVVPMCALPREVWKQAGKKGGAKVIVRFRGIEVDGILGDTMPALANIKNGAGIDLNPAFSEALGLTPPYLQAGVEWRWA